MADFANIERQSRRRTVAKKWRDTEGCYISQLAALLPYPATVKARMNKLDILRIATTLMYARTLEDDMGGSAHALEEANTIMDALDGFLLSVDQQGLILHVSHHVYNILGHHSYFMIGHNIADYLYHEDIETFFNYMKPSPENKTYKDNPPAGEDRSFIVRMKYRILENSNKVKQAGYVGINLKGRLKNTKGPGDLSGETTGENSPCVLVAACYVHCSTPCIEIKYFESNYVVRFDKNDRLAYVEDWVYDCWGVKIRPYIGHHVKLGVNPADLTEWCSPWDLFHKKGSMVVGFSLVTRAGHVFQGVTHDTMVYGPKGEKLFWVGVRYVNRIGTVKIKHWPVKLDIVFIGHNYGLPGEQPRPMKSHFEDIAESLEDVANGNKDLGSSPYLHILPGVLEKENTHTEQRQSTDFVDQDNNNLQEVAQSNIHENLQELNQDTGKGTEFMECFDNLLDSDVMDSQVTSFHEEDDSQDLQLTLDPFLSSVELPGDLSDVIMDLFPLSTGLADDNDKDTDNSSIESMAFNDTSLSEDSDSPVSSVLNDNITQHILHDHTYGKKSVSFDLLEEAVETSSILAEDLNLDLEPDVIDFVLNEQPVKDMSLWHPLELLSGQTSKYFQSIECSDNTSTKREVTLRELLLQR